MGFVETADDLKQYFAHRERKFEGAQVLGVMGLTTPAAVKRFLPPPLEPFNSPNVLMFIATYPKTDLGPGYSEAALLLLCKYRDEAGTYCLSMPITDEARMHNGRDIFGFPKKLANIHLSRTGQEAHGYVERNGVRFVEVKASLSGSIPQLPPLGPNFLFKAMPRIDLTPGFDGPVFLVRQQTDVVPRHIDAGKAEVILRPSAADPWHDVPFEQVLISYYLESDNTMQPGKVLAEVDGNAFLPHYYKMTDFCVGTTGGAS